EALAGQAFNIGGGPANTTSLIELLGLVSELRCEIPDVRFDAWRPVDQQYYVSDTRKFSAATGWTQKVGVRDGVTRLYNWLQDSRAAAAPNGRATGRHNGKVVPLPAAPLRLRTARGRPAEGKLIKGG